MTWVISLFSVKQISTSSILLTLFFVQRFNHTCNDKPLTYIIDFSNIYFAIFIFIDKEIVT